MIPGLIGRKLGMTQVFNQDGTQVGVTVLEAGPCTITQVRTREKEGYSAIQMGFGQARRLSRPEKGHLKGLEEMRYLREFRVADAASFQVGQKIAVDAFQVGERVDVVGISKGKGYAGVVKRYHFAGGPKTHGQSDRWRAPGSIGATTSPGRVLKGKRMAGHMGDERVTVKNLEVVVVDAGRNLLLIRGAVPGARGGLVLIHSRGGR